METLFKPCKVSNGEATGSDEHKRQGVVRAVAFRDSRFVCSRCAFCAPASLTPRHDRDLHGQGHLGE